MTTPLPEGCEPVCMRAAAAQLLGPLQPNASVCRHGHRFTRDELWPRTADFYECGRTVQIEGVVDGIRVRTVCAEPTPCPVHGAPEG